MWSNASYSPNVLVEYGQNSACTVTVGEGNPYCLGLELIEFAHIKPKNMYWVPTIYQALF